MNKDIRPFWIDIPEAILEDLRQRLARTRWSDEFNDANRSYGSDLSSLKELCAYWEGNYDWRARGRLNSIALHGLRQKLAAWTST